MTHLVATFADLPLPDARRQLIEAHEFLIARCIDAVASIPNAGPLWGIQTKRLQVDLATTGRPAVICKDAERFGEVVNMSATIERLIAAIEWLERQPDCQGLRVKECHPSTSSFKGSNDLMLEDATGRIVLRCEVSDVASTSASSNGKEEKEIANLGCTNGVPSDGVRRFICTSPEFARAIQSDKRRKQRPHRYQEFAVEDPGGTILVELMPIENVATKVIAESGA